MKFHVRNISLLSLIIGIAFLILLLAGMYFVAKGIYLILLYMTPIFLIAALLLDYKVVLSYGNWLVNKYKRNILSGISWTLVTIFGFPVVAAILCFRAYARFRIRQINDEVPEDKDEYVDYEIVEDERLEIHETHRENRS